MDNTKILRDNLKEIGHSRDGFLLRSTEVIETLDGELMVVVRKEEVDGYGPAMDAIYDKSEEDGYQVVPFWVNSCYCVLYVGQEI